MKPTIGFVGIGIMGQGMSRNLLGAGYEVVLWNRTRSRAEALAGEGARLADSPQAVAESSEVIITCVSDTPDVEQVVLGERGIIHGLGDGALLIDCSTISPSKTREIAIRVEEKRARMLDAPISGGSEGAAKGTLSIMVGGEAADFERSLPVLQAMGTTITHVGPIGSGQMAKLVNQILVVGSMQSMGEALLFAQAGGLDLEKTLEAVSGGAAGSWTLSNRGPQVIKRDWRPGFMIDLQQKDLRLVLEAADELSVPVMSCSIAFHLYRTLQSSGCGSEGNHALVKALEALAGIQVGEAPPESD